MNNIPELVLPIVRKTRDMLLPFWGNAVDVKSKGGNATDVVTKCDKDVERYLAEELKKIFPDIEFAGEEFGGSREAKRFWLCDPIDGTAHFVRGLPFCTVMLALIEDGQVTFSVIYDFINDAIYHAVKGEGAYKNGALLKMKHDPATSFYVAWETHLDMTENLEKFLKLQDFIIPFKTISSGYEFAMVAEGRIEGRIGFDSYGSDYDFAPGALLVSEAGGIVANVGASTYDYKNIDVIAANRPLYEKLTQGSEAIFPIVK
jgi:myo-inositol-1(or 4)-monophosphatase